MKFKNNGEALKIRIGDLINFIWKTICTGEIVDLKKSIGRRLGLEEVTESNQELPKTTKGQIGNQVVETKQIETENKDTKEGREQAEFVTFHKKLNDINGIGEKTTKDIIKVFPTEEKLKEAIAHDDELPFRDDIEKKLRDKYE